MVMLGLCLGRPLPRWSRVSALEPVSCPETAGWRCPPIATPSVVEWASDRTMPQPAAVQPLNHTPSRTAGPKDAPLPPMVAVRGRTRAADTVYHTPTARSRSKADAQRATSAGRPFSPLELDGDNVQPTGTPPRLNPFVKSQAQHKNANGSPTRTASTRRVTTLLGSPKTQPVAGSTMAFTSPASPPTYHGSPKSAGRLRIEKNGEERGRGDVAASRLYAQPGVKRSPTPPSRYSRGLQRRNSSTSSDGRRRVSRVGSDTPTGTVKGRHPPDSPVKSNGHLSMRHTTRDSQVSHVQSHPSQFMSLSTQSALDYFLPRKAEPVDAAVWEDQEPSPPQKADATPTKAGSAASPADASMARDRSASGRMGTGYSARGVSPKRSEVGSAEIARSQLQVQDLSVATAYTPVTAHSVGPAPVAAAYVDRRDEEEMDEIYDLTSQVKQLRSTFEDMKKQEEMRELKKELRELKQMLGAQSALVQSNMDLLQQQATVQQHQQLIHPAPPTVVLSSQSAFSPVHMPATPNHAMLQPQPQPQPQLQTYSMPQQPQQPQQPLFVPHGSVLRGGRSVGNTPEVVGVETAPLGQAWFNNIPPEGSPSPIEITVQKF